MKKRITALLLAFAMFYSMMVPAFALDTVDSSSAIDTPEVTLINLSNQATAQELREIRNSVGAEVIFDDGTAIPIDSVVTVEDVIEENSPRARDGSLSTEKSYKVTVEATASSDNDKIVSNSGQKNGKTYNVSTTLQLIWTDGPGLENVIKKVSGTLTIVKGKVTAGTVSWGDGWSSAVTWAERDVGDASSFSYSPNWTVPCPKAGYSVTIEDCLPTLYITASSSVLQ